MVKEGSESMKAYAVKAATDVKSAKELLEDGWEPCGKIENIWLFRKKIAGV